MSYKITMDPFRRGKDKKVVVAGCGGTGGFVAEGLCRPGFIPEDIDLLLVDHDRVEPHNLRRQNFYQGDVGKFKSQVLAERLAAKYRRRIGFSILPYSRELLTEHFGHGLRSINSGLVIGCVDDSTAARVALSKLEWDDWWLDAGNGFHSGQVLFGNATDPRVIKECFDEKLNEVYKLPAPSLQLPGLLIPQTKVEKPRDCAEAVEVEAQSPVINQAIATLVLDFVYKLFRGELTWMGAYLDLEAGTLSTVPAEPITVARMLGVKVNTLMVPRRKKK